MPESNEIDYYHRLRMSALQIATSYVDGYSSLKLLYEIFDVQKNDCDKFLTFPHLFNCLYDVCYQSVIIKLANILVADDESLNIFYLNSLINQLLPENRMSEDLSELQKTIQKITSLYSKESAFYLGLKEIRDKYIAHIDKKRFHSSTGVINEISLEEIKLAYESISNLVGNLIERLWINPELVNFEKLDKTDIQFQLLVKEIHSNPVK